MALKSPEGEGELTVGGAEANSWAATPPELSRAISLVTPYTKYSRGVPKIVGFKYISNDNVIKILFEKE